MCLFIHLYIYINKHQTMVSLYLNTTEISNNSGLPIGTYENRSIFMFFFLIIALFAPSIGCTIFLLLHFARLYGGGGGSGGHR